MQLIADAIYWDENPSAKLEPSRFVCLRKYKSAIK